MQKGSKEIEWSNQYHPDQPKTKVKHDFTDGDNVKFYNPYANNKKGETQKFDANDALVVFDKNGKLVGATQVLIPDKEKYKQTHTTWDDKDTTSYKGKWLGLKVNNDPRQIHGPIGSIGCIQASPLSKDFKVQEKGSESWQKIRETIKESKDGQTLGKMKLVGY